MTCPSPARRQKRGGVRLSAGDVGFVEQALGTRLTTFLDELPDLEARRQWGLNPLGPCTRRGRETFADQRFIGFLHV